MRYLKNLSGVLFIMVLGICLFDCKAKPDWRAQKFWDNKQTAVNVVYTYVSKTANADGTAGAPALKLGNFGTGTVVDMRGLVVTNNHVLREENDSKLAVSYPEKKDRVDIFIVCNGNEEKDSCRPAVLLAADAKLDLALLQVDGEFERAVDFGSDQALKDSDPFSEDKSDLVYLWGKVYYYTPVSHLVGRYINHVEPDFYKGRGISAALPVLLLDMTISPGSSGGPVFNADGECVGVADAYTIFGGRNLGVLIPSGTVASFVKHNIPFSQK